MGRDLRKVSHRRESWALVTVHLRCLEWPALGKLDIPKYGTFGPVAGTLDVTNDGVELLLGRSHCASSVGPFGQHRLRDR